MQLAAHTYAFRDRPLEKALDAIAALGFDAVEVWAGHANAGPEAAGEAVAARGLHVAAVSAGGFYDPDDEALARVLSLTRALGAPVVVACLAPTLADWVTGALPDDLTLCVENHWDQPLARSGDVLTAIAATPRLGAALDTGHALLAGESPEAAVATLGSRLGHVHLKDARRPPLPVRLLGRRLRRRLFGRPSPVWPGEGSLEVGALRAKLAATGFAGTVSLEFEGDVPERALERLLAAWEDAG